MRRRDVRGQPVRLRRRTRDAGGDLASLIEGAGDPAGAEAPERKGSAHPTRRRLLIGVGAALLLVGAGAGTAAAAGGLPGQARKNEYKPAEFTGTT